MREQDNILAKTSQPCDLSKICSMINSLLRQTGGKRAASYEREFDLSLWRQSGNWVIWANSVTDFIELVISCRSPTSSWLRLGLCKSWIQTRKEMHPWSNPWSMLLFCVHTYTLNQTSVSCICSLKCPNWAAKSTCPICFASVQVCTSSLARDRTGYSHPVCWEWRKVAFDDKIQNTWNTQWFLLHYFMLKKITYK